MRFARDLPTIIRRHQSFALDGKLIDVGSLVEEASSAVDEETQGGGGRDNLCGRSFLIANSRYERFSCYLFVQFSNILQNTSYCEFCSANIHEAL